jgi:hypothetical protein
MLFPLTILKKKNQKIIGLQSSELFNILIIIMFNL